MPRFLAILLLSLSAAYAVEIRVASLNVGALYVSGGPVYGLGDPGTAGYEATLAVLARINADVVALQEIHNADIDNEPSGTPEDVEVLAAALGYPYIYNPPRTSLDFTFRVIILSKYPFSSTTSITSPEGANEITRRFPAVKVDVPGTNNDPLIISGHLKSGSTAADRFRRAIEMRRLNDHLISSGVTADDNFVILGDFNLVSSNQTFTSAPTGLPSTYNLGTDVTFPVTYSTNPLSYFSTVVPSRVNLRQLDGSAATFRTGSVLDIMLLSPAFAGRPVSSEIYNSTLDTSNSSGLPKSGSPLPSSTSDTASDHFAIFADLELDQDFPNLDLTITPNTVMETAPVGTANLRIAIPATRTSDLVVSVSSDETSIANPAQTSVVIPAGSLFVNVPILTSRNFINDEGNSVAFTASATNYDPDTAILQVTDSDGPYIFTAVNQTVTENFSGFTGNHDPAPWSTSGNLPWLGSDNGTSASAGFRSYGTSTNSSMGFLAESGSSATGTFTSTFTNNSTEILTALEIALNATHWRAGGNADKLTAEIVTTDQTYQLPRLTYQPPINLPSGPLSPTTITPLLTTIDGLDIPPGQSFDLRFTITPGTGGGTLPSDVFINEFHYDNDGPDVGEFVEVVVSPGYTGPLSDLRLYLYNGADGAVYNASTAYTLDTFTLGSTTPSGHRIFYRMISGIQNGNPDGFAITRAGQVLHFISYGGVFTATNGPAAGMASVDTGFTQPSSTPINTNSIRLIGSGGSASNLTWTKTAIPHSPGQINEGQTLTVPSQSQGIGLDDIKVTFLPPDIDSDGDGFTDRIEQYLLLTDPNDGSSKFSTTINAVSPSLSRISFPTLAGRSYRLQTSEDLITWDQGTVYSGNGAIRQIDIPILPEKPKLFLRVIVSFE